MYIYIYSDSVLVFNFMIQIHTWFLCIWISDVFSMGFSSSTATFTRCNMRSVAGPGNGQAWDRRCRPFGKTMENQCSLQKVGLKKTLDYGSRWELLWDMMGIWWVFHVLHQLPCLSSYKLKLLNTYYSKLLYSDLSGTKMGSRMPQEHSMKKLCLDHNSTNRSGEMQLCPQTELGPGRWPNLIKHGLWKWEISIWVSQNLSIYHGFIHGFSCIFPSKMKVAGGIHHVQIHKVGVPSWWASAGAAVASQSWCDTWVTVKRRWNQEPEEQKTIKNL